MSCLAFSLSFVFPVTSITVLNTLSKKFFSICITSRLWRNKLSFQYGRSQNILLFVQLCVTPYPSILHALPVSVNFGSSQTWFHIATGDNRGGGRSVTRSPFLKFVLFFLKG